MIRLKDIKMQPKLIGLMLFAVTLVFTPNSFAAGGNKAHWSYSGSDGPAKWGSLAAEYSTCTTGMTQSPINISKTSRADLGDIEIDYRATPLKILNNGHAIQVNYSSDSYMRVGGKTYKLLQFHFHSPSEDTVDGKHYAMQAHFVHKSDDGQLAVLGVFLKEGRQNSFVQTLWDNFPTSVGLENVNNYVSINGSELLPSVGSYYHFSGSLTTPPCSEGVQWYVLKNPVEVSSAQVQKFVSSLGETNRPPNRCMTGLL